MEIMSNKYRISLGIIAVCVVFAILVPCQTLYTGDGYLADYFAYSVTRRMFIEISILLVLLTGVFYGLGRQSAYKAVIGLAVLWAGFCYLHVVLFPMVFSGLYLLSVMMLGDRVRTLFVREKAGEETIDPGTNFVLGASTVLVVYCLQSAAGIGSISVFRRVISVIMALSLVTMLPKYRNLAKNKISVTSYLKKIKFSGLIYPIGCAFVALMIFIQAGRVGTALDFDSLWYVLRSEYLVAGAKGLYEDPKVVGMVYVYAKGHEVLILPLSGLVSYGYVIFFNIWLVIFGMYETYRLARHLMTRKAAWAAVVCSSAVPGITNMSCSAKSDMVTWLIQMIMLEKYMDFMASGFGNSKAAPDESSLAGTRRVVHKPEALLMAGSAYLLSLTMKPTSIVFSTALFGMMGISILLFNREGLMETLKSGRKWLLVIFPAAALAGIWLRTYLITGMPAMSVFTGIFGKMGFSLKYPFDAEGLPSNYAYEALIPMLLNRLYMLAFAPKGHDGHHIIMAWGTSLIPVLVAAGFILRSVNLFSDRADAAGTQADKTPRGYFAEMIRNRRLWLCFNLIFIPFVIVNILSLIMLYQVDGNYFMILYTLTVCKAVAVMGDITDKRALLALGLILAPLLVFNIVVTANTNWAWTTGFNNIELVNKGRIDNKEKNEMDFEYRGVSEIWDILSENPQYHVLSFGTHPQAVMFPCIAQSYKDVIAPWGNDALVEDLETTEAYLDYTGTDFVYAEAGYMGDHTFPWGYGLVRDMIADGYLTDLVVENGHVLARVSHEKVDKKTAAANLELFDREYVTAE